MVKKNHTGAQSRHSQPADPFLYLRPDPPMACLHGLGWPLTITFRTGFTTSHQETPMPDLDTTALIERLQKSNRRWKRLALSLLAALGLAVVLLTTSVVVLGFRVEQERQRAQAAEAEARKQSEDDLIRRLKEAIEIEDGPAIWLSTK
jgi:hypothetical protein